MLANALKYTQPHPTHHFHTHHSHSSDMSLLFSNSAQTVPNNVTLTLHNNVTEM